MIADDNVDCAGYEDRDHVDVPSDGANTASTADDSTDAHIADKVDDTVAAGNNCRWDAAVAEPGEHFEVAVDQVRTDIAVRKPG